MMDENQREHIYKRINASLKKLVKIDGRIEDKKSQIQNLTSIVNELEEQVINLSAIHR